MLTSETITLGQRVHYHPVLPGDHDGRIYTVRAYRRLRHGPDVAWLSGQRGCVAIAHLSPAPPEGVVAAGAEGDVQR